MQHIGPINNTYCILWCDVMVNTKARHFRLISLFPAHKYIIHQLLVDASVRMREGWKGKPSGKVNTCLWAITRSVLVKQKPLLILKLQCAKIRGPEQQSQLSYLPGSS